MFRETMLLPFGKQEVISQSHFKGTTAGFDQLRLCHTLLLQESRQTGCFGIVVSNTTIFYAYLFHVKSSGLLGVPGMNAVETTWNPRL